MGSLFKRGYEASRQEIAKQEERSKQMGNRLFRFFVPADDKGKASEKDVVFLTENPVNFEEHTVYHQADNVTEYYTCKGKNCPLCANGVKKTAKGAYLLIDLSHFEYKNKQGKKIEGDERLLLYVQGMRAIGQLDRLHSKRGGVSMREMTVVRMGKGTGTTYTFESGDKVKMSLKHIKSLMPEKMAEDWDGTQDGLMDIIEEQLKMAFPQDGDDDDDFVDDDDDFGGDDDSYEVSSGDEDDDEEEEERPKKKKAKKKKSKSKMSMKLSGGKKKKSTFKSRKDEDDDENEGFMEIDEDDDDEIPFS